jgi:hypothetical protein
MDAISKDREAAPAKLDPAEVCTLSPEGLSERMAWIRDEILPHARRRERLASGLAWELDAGPGLVEKLDHLVALERECCSGIVFERMNGPQPGQLRLEVRGIDPGAPVFRALDVQHEDGDTRGTRLAKAGGLGFLAALVACCALPLVASALVGGAAAASLARLDAPWAIALGTLSVSAAAWWRLGRRAKSRASSDGTNRRCGPAC